MKKNFLKSLQINLIITFGTGILGFTLNKYFSEYMGLNDLGLMKLFTQMIAYLSLAELGLGNASAYALYRPLEEKNIEKINIVISTISSFYKKISGIILITGIGISFFIPYLIEAQLMNRKIYIYWLLYVINTSLGYIFAKYSILFIANQEYDFVRKVQGSGKIILQLFQIIILVKTQSFILFILIMILENFYSYYFYNKHYKKRYYFIKKVVEREKSIIRDMKNLFWHKIGDLIVFNTDYIILSKFVSLSIVGIYSSYMMIYQIALVFINILNPILRPIVGAFVVKNSEVKNYFYWRELYTIYIVLGNILVITIYLLIIPFIKLWLGEEFILSNLTIVLILVNLFIHLIRGATDIFKDCCGFFDDTYTPILESFLNFIFSLILVKKIGLNGVIIGTLISNVIIIYILRPILVFKRCFKKSGVVYIKDSLKLLIFSFIGILVILKIVNYFKINLLEIDSWSILIYKGVKIGLISTLTIIIVFLCDKYFRNFLLKNIKS